MGGGGSKILQAVTPQFEWYNVYMNIPADADQRINWYNNEIRIRRQAYEDTLNRLNNARRNLNTVAGQRDYWQGEVNRLQSIVNGLIKEIQGLQAQLDEIKKNTGIEKETHDENQQKLGVISDQLHGDAKSNDGLLQQATLANRENIDKKETLFYTIHSQNKRLMDQYNNTRNSLTMNDKNSLHKDTKNEYLNGVNWYLFWFYYAILAILSYVILFVEKNMGFYYKLLIIALIGIYPFAIYYIEFAIYYVLVIGYAIITGTPIEIERTTRNTSV